MTAKGTSLAIAVLPLVWFLAAPYAHFYDEVLLTVPVLALLGRNGAGLGRAVPTLVLYLMFFSLLLISAAPGGVQLLSLPLLVVTALAWRTAPLLARQPA